MDENLKIRSFAIVCFCLVGCEKAGPVVESVRADSPIAIAKSGIDTTITLGAWLTANPKDSVTAQYRHGGDPESVCRVAVGMSTLGPYPATRFAVFHALAPAGEQLPSDTTRFAEQACRLRTILVETGALDSTIAVALADSMATVLDGELGKGKEGTKAGPAMSEGWTHGKTWIRPGTTVSVAISPLAPLASSAETEPAPTRSVDAKPTARKLIMVSYAPGSSVQDEYYWAARYAAADQRTRESENLALRDADSAIVWAGLPSIGADLNIMLAELRRPRGGSDTLRNPDADSALLRAVRATRDTAPLLDPPRRAAALLAAELVRFAAVPYPPPGFDTPDGSLFSNVQEIIRGPLGNRSLQDFIFNRVWLWDAYELDSLGRVGHIAFVRLLKRSFRRDAECAEDRSFYDDMITHGEEGLRRGIKDPRVHFYLGIANKTIFDLAHTKRGVWVDQLPTKADAERARLKAIDHFRAALGGVDDPLMRREAWEMAAKLILRMPRNPIYFCAAD